MYHEKLNSLKLETWTTAILLGEETRDRTGSRKYLSTSAHEPAIHRAETVYFEAQFV